MYALKVLLNKKLRLFGECDWERSILWLNPARIWKIFIEEHHDPTIRNETQEFKETLFTIVLRETLFHEYLHEFLYEERIRPWRCNNCKAGKCKLCNLTNALIGYF